MLITSKEGVHPGVGGGVPSDPDNNNSTPSSEVDSGHTTVSSGACSAKRSAASKYDTSELNINFSSQYCRKETFYLCSPTSNDSSSTVTLLCSQLILLNEAHSSIYLVVIIQWLSVPSSPHLLSSFHRLSRSTSLPNTSKRCQCTTHCREGYPQHIVRQCQVCYIETALWVVLVLEPIHELSTAVNAHSLSTNTPSMPSVNWRRRSEQMDRRKEWLIVEFVGSCGRTHVSDSKLLHEYQAVQRIEQHLVTLEPLCEFWIMTNSNDVSQPVNIVLDLEQCSLMCRIALGPIQFRCCPWSLGQ